MRTPCKILIALISIAGFLGSAYALVGGGCPLCSGHVVEYCNVVITPPELFYKQEVTVNVTMMYMGVASPIDEKTDVEVWFYNESYEVEKLKFKAGKTGIIKFTPRLVTNYLVRVCGKAILVFVNTTCGDGVCGGTETRETCASDCGNCGDGVCDSNEDLQCSDCSVCGDGSCSSGESRFNCIIDCVFCGDTICDYVESRSSCASDCMSGEADGFCDGEADDICDPDCEADKDNDCQVEAVVQPSESAVSSRKQEEPNDILPILTVAAALVLALIGLVLLRRRKACPRKEPEKEPEKA